MCTMYEHLCSNSFILLSYSDLRFSGIKEANVILPRQVELGMTRVGWWVGGLPSKCLSEWVKKIVKVNKK